MTEDQALQLALDHARADPYNRFPHAYVDRITVKDRAWIIRILSNEPEGPLDGGHYMDVSVDEDGMVMTLGAGGGS